MTKLPELKAAKVIKCLEMLGFEKARHKGGHAIFRHPDGRWTTIPIHPAKSIDPDLLRDILKQTNIGREEFMATFRKRARTGVRSATNFLGNDST